MAVFANSAAALLGSGKARAALLAVLWWLVGAGQFSRYVGPAATLLLLPVIVAVVLIITGRRAVSEPTRQGPLLRRAVALAPPVAAVAAFAVLYPLARHHMPGGGEGDTLDWAAAALLGGRNPYAVQIGPVRPLLELPGAFILAAPFRALGAAALQNPLWMTIFLVRFAAWFPDPRRASMWSAFLLVNPGFLRGYGVGNDYAIDGIVLVLAIDCIVAAWRPGRASGAKAAALVVSALVLSTHPVFWVVLPVTLLGVGRLAGRRAGLTFAVALCLLVAAICLPFYLGDPDRFTPLQLVAAAASMRPVFWSLPLLGAVGSVLVLGRTPRRSDILAGAALSLGIVILPPLAAHLVAAGFDDYAVLGLPVLLCLTAAWAPVLRPIRPERDRELAVQRPHHA
jgi:hypothetical protein